MKNRDTSGLFRLASGQRISKGGIHRQNDYPEHKERVFLRPDGLGLIRYDENKYCGRIARVRQNTDGDSAGL
jgi:molybdenum cofactor biosynthesis enzyme MoaA